MSEINVTLFHANWCKHCNDFMPEWNKFVEKFQNVDGVNVNTVEQKDPEFANLATINGKSVRGFPTVKFGTPGDEFEYNGPRDERSLTKTVKTMMSGGQSGGGKKKVKKTKKKAKRKTKSKTKTKGKKKSKKTKKTKKSKSKSKSKSKRSKQRGGAMTEQQVRDLLIHKIEKYQKKFESAYAELKNKGYL